MSLARATASWATSATVACRAVCATREVLLFTTKAPLRRGIRLRFEDARHLLHRPRVPGWKEGGVGRLRGEPPLQVQSPPQQWRAADPYALLLTLSRRPRPRDWGVAAPLSCPYSPECVEGEFSEVREENCNRYCN